MFCFTEKIDGGSENVARAALAICHLLVARRLTKKVVATRLLVGHTHEDIDAVFALIWQLMKTMQVNTPQLYAKVVRSACKNKAPEVEVYDIWAVPDYKSFIEPFIDKKLGRYAKGNCLSSNFYFQYLILILQNNGLNCKSYLKLWRLLMMKFSPNILWE